MIQIATNKGVAALIRAVTAEAYYQGHIRDGERHGYGTYSRAVFAGTMRWAV